MVPVSRGTARILSSALTCLAQPSLGGQATRNVCDYFFGMFESLTTQLHDILDQISLVMEEYSSKPVSPLLLVHPPTMRDAHMAFLQTQQAELGSILTTLLGIEEKRIAIRISVYRQQRACVSPKRQFPHYLMNCSVASFLSPLKVSGTKKALVAHFWLRITCRKCVENGIRSPRICRHGGPISVYPPTNCNMSTIFAGAPSTHRSHSILWKVPSRLQPSICLASFIGDYTSCQSNALFR